MLSSLLFYLLNGGKKTEPFYQGIYCTNCSGKNYNKCVDCFNCGWCVDKHGRGKCVGGDVNNGPYNKENCHLWYSGDPYNFMKYENYIETEKKYKCNYGPNNYNRAITGPYYSAAPIKMRTNIFL